MSPVHWINAGRLSPAGTAGDALPAHCRRLPVASAALILLALAPAVCAAADYYVNHSSPLCSDAGPGTVVQPYCTIAAAMAAHAGPGVTIDVMPGTYREQVTVPVSGVAGSPFTLKALG